MTTEQLEALAEYRKHKNCDCCHCQEARKILKQFDQQPRVSGHKTS